MDYHNKIGNIFVRDSIVNTLLLNFKLAEGGEFNLSVRQFFSSQSNPTDPPLCKNLRKILFKLSQYLRISCSFSRHLGFCKSNKAGNSNILTRFLYQG